MLCQQKKTGNAIVIFANERDAQKAIEGLDRTIVDTRTLYVRVDRPHLDLI